MGGGKEDLNSCPLLMMTQMKILMSDVHWDRWESWHLFHSEAMHRVSVSSSCSHQKGGCVKSENKSAVLKRTMTERLERWPKKRSGKTKPIHIGGHLLVENLDKARMISGGVQNRKATGK